MGRIVSRLILAWVALFSILSTGVNWGDKGRGAKGSVQASDKWDLERVLNDYCLTPPLSVLPDPVHLTGSPHATLQHGEASEDAR